MLLFNLRINWSSGLIKGLISFLITKSGQPNPRGFRIWKCFFPSPWKKQKWIINSLDDRMQNISNLSKSYRAVTFVDALSFFLHPPINEFYLFHCIAAILVLFWELKDYFTFRLSKYCKKLIPFKSTNFRIPILSSWYYFYIYFAQQRSVYKERNWGMTK